MNRGATLSTGATHGKLRPITAFSRGWPILVGSVSSLTLRGAFPCLRGATVAATVAVKSMAIYAIDGSGLRLVPPDPDDPDDTGSPDELYIRESWDSRVSEPEAPRHRDAISSAWCVCALCCRPWEPL
jgi:hypothetical protein